MIIFSSEKAKIPDSEIYNFQSKVVSVNYDSKILIVWYEGDNKRNK